MADHVCPVWVGRLMANPIRKWFQSPKAILGGYLKAGMTALDVGCAMGFFSLPLARMVGPAGSVVCVDLQPEMLARLVKRAARASLVDRIEPRRCQADSLGIGDLHGRVDFALAFAMVHETPDPVRLLGELADSLAPGGRLLVAEPRGHVDEVMFGQTLGAAAAAGLQVGDRPAVRWSHAALLTRAGGAAASSQAATG